MKPFLGIDVTFNTENDIRNGNEFLATETPAYLLTTLDNATDRMTAAIKKSKLPPWLDFIYWIAGILGGIFGASFILAAFRGNVFKGFHNAPWLYYLGFGSILLWVILTIISTKHENKVLKKPESIKAKDDALSSFDAILDYLGVPKEAEEIDILCHKYFTDAENGMPKIFTTPLQSTKFVNQSYRIFKDTDTLYLTNPQGKYAFPLKNLRTIRTVYEDATIPHWQKNDDFDSDKYKAYSITYNKNLGIFQTSPYHILELELNGEIWGIYFPCYEIRTIENLTGLKDWGF